MSRRQSHLTHRCWYLTAACACATAAALMTPALSTAGGHFTWWFQREAGRSAAPSMRPVSGVPSVISTGEANGKRWSAVAYLMKAPFDHGRELVEVTMLVGSLGSNPGDSEGMALSGMPEPAWVTKANPRHFFGFGDSPADWTGPSIMTGAVAGQVARLVIVSKPDRAGQRTTTEAPLERVAAVGYGVRVFAFPLYPDTRIDTVSAYSSSGKLLQQWRNRPHHPSGP